MRKQTYEMCNINLRAIKLGLAITNTIKKQ